MLDPDIRRLLDTAFDVAASPGSQDIAQLRAAAEEAPKRLGGEPEKLASIEDIAVPGAAGPIALRVYRPEAESALPIVLYAHGGGWVTGSLESHDRLCRLLAKRLPA